MYCIPWCVSTAHGPFEKVAMSQEQEISRLYEVAARHGFTPLSLERGRERKLRSWVRAICSASSSEARVYKHPLICVSIFVAQLNKKWHLPHVVHHFVQLWHWFLFLGHEQPTLPGHREHDAPSPRPEPNLASSSTYTLLDTSTATQRSSAWRDLNDCITNFASMY